MDVAPLSAAYAALLEDAASHDFAASSDGGWNAGQVLAHIVISDRDFASVCAELLLGRNPGYDNRASQAAPYLDAVVRAAGSWQALMESVRRGGEELLELLSQFSAAQAGQQIVCSGVMGEREIVMKMTAAEFAGNLAMLHLPAHHQQLLALAALPA
jgi:hypothetical protein